MKSNETGVIIKGGNTMEDMIETKAATETLKCILTDKEKLSKGRELADVISEKDSHESELEAVKKDFNGKIKTCESRIKSLTTHLSTGYEYRPVKVIIIFDYDVCEVRKIRDDTGEIFDKRTMSNEERQMALDLKDRE